jgi:hypothetical protein
VDAAAAPQHVCLFRVAFGFVNLAFIANHKGRPLVDRALNLNVLAAFAAFMVVGAILLGAF